MQAKLIIADRTQLLAMQTALVMPVALLRLIAAEANPQALECAQRAQTGSGTTGTAVLPNPQRGPMLCRPGNICQQGSLPSSLTEPDTGLLLSSSSPDLLAAAERFMTGVGLALWLTGPPRAISQSALKALPQVHVPCWTHPAHDLQDLLGAPGAPAS